MSAKPKNRRSQEFMTLEYFGSRPWRTERDGDLCNILAYAKAEDRWMVVAIIFPFGKVSAERMARFIVRIVDERLQHGHLLYESYKAFKGIFEIGLNFTTEQDAEIVYEKLKRVPFWSTHSS
jgi:hypothetical protein